MLIDFSPQDLTSTRFAISPLTETIASFTALRCTDEQPLLLPWIREAEARAAGLDAELLDVLLTTPFREGHRSYADFLLSYPRHLGTTIEEELQQLVATPAGDVRLDIEANYAGRDLRAFQRFFDDPETTLEALAQEILAYWHAVMEPRWPAIQLVLENDILYRAHLLTDAGLGPLFASLGHQYVFEGSQLQIGDGAEAPISLSGRGILLMPSVFTKKLGLGTKRGREALVYRARGIGMAFADQPFRPAEALVGLLGRPRAALLERLQMPATTGDLAAFFEVTPGAISQHVGWLKDAGLVVTRKIGPRSLHALTVVGQGVLDAYHYTDRVPIPWQPSLGAPDRDAGGSIPAA